MHPDLDRRRKFRRMVRAARAWFSLAVPHSLGRMIEIIDSDGDGGDIVAGFSARPAWGKRPKKKGVGGRPPGEPVPEESPDTATSDEPPLSDPLPGRLPVELLTGTTRERLRAELAKWLTEAQYHIGELYRQAGEMDEELTSNADSPLAEFLSLTEVRHLNRGLEDAWSAVSNITLPPLSDQFPNPMALVREAANGEGGAS
jgi:hypothetical protein